MAIAMFMTWDGVTAAQYDEVRAVVQWETQQPEGGMLHIASAADDGLHVCDVWASPEQFDRFVNERLMPGVQQVGITSEPKVTVLPLHSLYLPDANALDALQNPLVTS